ncbi:MAG: ABC transporter substrate-binding protein [Promethearchaeota archaeon]
MERRAKILFAGLITVILVGAGIAVIVPILLSPDVRIGYLTADLHQLALFVALDQGFFLEEGLRVETVEFQSGNYEMSGFLGGIIDIGYVGAAPALNFHINTGVEIRLMAGVNLEGSAIVVASNINSMADLIGQSVATPAPGNVQDILFALACNQSGVDFLNDIHRLHLSPTMMIQQLQSGQISGFVAWEPYIASSLDQSVGKILNTSHEIWPSHPCCVVASQLNFLQTRPDIVEKVIRIHKRATDFINNNHSLAIQIGVKWTGFSEVVIETAMSRILYNTSLISEGFRVYLNALAYYDFISGYNSTQIDALLDYIVDDQFLEGGS